jgi:hypothetical protein
MSFQLRPPSTPRPRPTPPRSEGGGAFAVGSKVLITVTTSGQRGVELSDENGTPLGTRLALDLPVTITAWRPRRGAPARYRVSSAEGVEGWVDAADLRRQPPPPPPVMAQPLSAPTPVAPAKASKPTALKPATPKIAKTAPVVAAKPARAAVAQPAKPAAKLAAKAVAKPVAKHAKPVKPAKATPSRKPATRKAGRASASRTRRR